MVDSRAIHLDDNIGSRPELPFRFPGVEVLAIPRSPDQKERDLNSGQVQIYATVPNQGVAGVVRLNLFAELLGVRQHVASAFVQAGAPPSSVIVVSGHCVDGWHLLAQATSPKLTLRATIGSMKCCAEPRVRVNKDNINPPPFAGPELAQFGTQFVDPAMAPWGRENGQYEQFNLIADAGPTETTFSQGARVTHMLFHPQAGGGTYSFENEFGVPIEGGGVPAGTVAELFPNGDLRAGSIVTTGVDLLIVETVR